MRAQFVVDMTYGRLVGRGDGGSLRRAVRCLGVSLGIPTSSPVPHSQNVLVPAGEPHQGRVQQRRLAVAFAQELYCSEQLYGLSPPQSHDLVLSWYTTC